MRFLARETADHSVKSVRKVDLTSEIFEASRLRPLTNSWAALTGIKEEREVDIGWRGKTDHNSNDQSSIEREEPLSKESGSDHLRREERDENRKIMDNRGIDQHTKTNR